jgi:hypothetical protein
MTTHSKTTEETGGLAHPMRYEAKRFKSLAVCLQELERFVKDGEHLQTGRGFKDFSGMRSREMLANWLLCAVQNFLEEKDRFTFLTDPVGGDGIIFDLDSNSALRTDHVMVPRSRKNQKPVPDAVISKIRQKIGKGGAPYAKGKILIVFVNEQGKWFPDKVARQLPAPLFFEAVWVVSLMGVKDEEYVYSVTNLYLKSGHAPVFFVKIEKDFNAWEVARVQ